MRERSQRHEVMREGGHEVMRSRGHEGGRSRGHEVTRGGHEGGKEGNPDPCSASQQAPRAELRCSDIARPPCPPPFSYRAYHMFCIPNRGRPWFRTRITASFDYRVDLVRDVWQAWRTGAPALTCTAFSPDGAYVLAAGGSRALPSNGAEVPAADWDGEYGARGVGCVSSERIR